MFEGLATSDSDSWSAEFSNRPIIVLRADKVFLQTNHAEVVEFSETQPGSGKEVPTTGSKGKIAKQLTRLLFLRAKKAVGIFSWLGMSTANIFSSIQERLQSRKDVSFSASLISY